jgi:hypothetical protein
MSDTNDIGRILAKAAEELGIDLATVSAKAAGP